MMRVSLSRSARLALMALAIGLVPASGAMARSGKDLVVACIDANGVVGAYDFGADQALPVVRPLQGGTAEGAARINACIRKSAAQQGHLYQARAMIQEWAPCQVEMVGGTGFDTCHKPW